MNNKKITKTAIFAALAIVFGYIESLIPLPVPIYGAKVGVSNTVILASLYMLGTPYAFGIMVMKTICQSLLFSGVTSFLYSFLGGLFSVAGMWLLKKTNRFGTVGISVLGGCLHNVGQLVAAGILISNLNTLYYLPILLVCGVISGVVIGIITDIVLKKLSGFSKNHL